MAKLIAAIAVLSWTMSVSGAEFVIGYVQMAKDPRYSAKRNYARYLTESLGRPHAGALVALKESKFVGAVLGVEFKLERIKAKDVADAVSRIEAMNDRGVGFFLVDAPADLLALMARDTTKRPLVLLNVSAREDRLRQAQCQVHLLHVIPSYAMLTDALGQYLVFRKWREVLVLEGPNDDDKAFAAAFARSAKRVGLRIVATRPFVLSNDPRERDRNNVALLTAGEGYDVVFVADTDGEFARDVPFQTVHPRPVVGSEGLAAVAWHWAWDRHGAPQLEKRFQKRFERPMRDVDWAAWMAFKAVVEAVLRTKSVDFAKVVAFMRSDEIILDGFKGNRVNFRPWNGQLRQPVLLVTHNWVVDRAPIKGFLHPTNNMDTLGFDDRDSTCKP